MYRRKRYYRSREDDSVQVIATLVLIALIVIGYYFRTHQAQLLIFEISSALVVAIGTILYFYLKASKRNHLKDLVERASVIEKRDGVFAKFIAQFGREKGTDLWSHKGYNFKNDDISILWEELNKLGLNIPDNKGETGYLLEHFIDEQEKNFVRQSISSNSLHKFADLSKNGKDFEYLVFRLSNAMGYSSKVIGTSGDQGGDVIANKAGESVLIQAKSYEHSSVGNSAVQEAAAAMKHYGCSKSIVVTTSFFTQEARELAKSNAVRLVDKDELKQLLLDNLHESWT